MSSETIEVCNSLVQTSVAVLKSLVSKPPELNPAPNFAKRAKPVLLDNAPTLVTAFTCGGLFEVGAMYAGFRPVLGVEFYPAKGRKDDCVKQSQSKAAADSYERNFGAHILRKTIEDAVRDRDFARFVKRHGRPNAFHCSPSCTNVSQGNTKGEEDAGDISAATAITCAIAQLKFPEIFTLENVAAYLKTKSWQIIQNFLYANGYGVSADVVMASDYGNLETGEGVPQDRKRLIVRAVKNAFAPSLPPKIAARMGWLCAIADLIDALPDGELAPWQIQRLPSLVKDMLIDAKNIHPSGKITCKEAIDPAFTVTCDDRTRMRAYLVRNDNTKQEWGKGYRDGEEPSVSVTTTFVPSAVLLNGQNASGAEVPHKNSTEPAFTITGGAKWASALLIEKSGATDGRITTRSPDKPCWTIRSSVGTDQKGHNRNEPINVVAGCRVKKLNARAIARLQSVPDWYELPGQMRDAGPLIGNGVPCLLSEAIMKSLLPYVRSAPEPVVCGVDESKRGCYFGPLFACAYVLDESHRDRVQKALAPNGKIRDSKQLSPQQRQELIALLQECGTWQLGYAKALEIDKMGVNVANDLAFTRAIAKLPVKPTKVLVDGNRRLKELPSDIEQVCLPQGDSKELAIAAASILVKEYSDRVIEYLGRNLPHNFKKHHGYSMDADLQEFGVDHPQFRKSFNSVKKLIYDRHRLQYGTSSQPTSASETPNLSGVLAETSGGCDNAGISKLNLPANAQNSGCHSSTQASSTDGVGVSVVPQQREGLVVSRSETKNTEQRSEIMVASLKTAISSPDARHALDFYETPAWMVIEAFKHLDISGVVGECCVGAGAIASLLKLFSSIEKVWTNDIDPNKPADYHCDATNAQSWSSFPESNWIITNPPYSDLAAPIVLNAYRKAKRGVVMFLRQSWLEGCDDRAEFLQQNPPTHLISLPRYCFRRGNKGTWTSDSSPVWAICWDKAAQGQQLITRTKEQISLYHRTPDTAPTMQEIQDAIASVSSNNLVKLDNFLQRKILSDVSAPVEYCAIAQIRRDGGTQPRQKLDLAHVKALREVLEDNGELDPVILFDDGTDKWLADGFHRTEASEGFGLLEIKARVFSGTLRDAILYSFSANADNKSAKPRSRQEKEYVVLAMLRDPEWSAWSDNEIARRCKVSQPYVSKLRRERTNNIISSSADSESTNNVISQSKRTYTKNGKSGTIDVGAIGRKKKDDVVEQICDAQADRGEYTNPWKIGDTCQIVKRGDATLAQYDGVWAIVSEVKIRQCVVQIWDREILVKGENLEELNVGQEFKNVCDRVRSLMKRHMTHEIELKRGQLAFLEALGSQSNTFELEDLELLSCIEARCRNHDAALVQATQFIEENADYLEDDEARRIFNAITQAHDLTTNP